MLLIPCHEHGLYHHAAGADEHGHKNEHKSGAQSGAGHMQELLPRTGAVERRRLIEVGADIRQPREENQHLIAAPLPGAQNHDPQHRGLGIAEPVVRRHAEDPEEGIEQSRLGGREDRKPQIRRDAERNHDRSEETDLEDPDPRFLPVDEHGEPERQPDLERHNTDDEFQRIDDRVVQHSVVADLLKRPLEVRDTGVVVHGRGTHQIELRKRIAERIQDREQNKEERHHYGGEQHQIRCQGRAHGIMFGAAFRPA